MEADPRHTEFILEQMSEYEPAKTYREVMTPGIDVDDDKADMGKELDKKHAKVFRSVTA